MPIPREEIARLVEGYGSSPVLAAVGSHSALDIADGAATEGFRTLVLGETGRERTYGQYFRSRRDLQGRLIRGCVDEVWTYPKFAALAAPESQARLRGAGALLVPN